MKVLKLLFKNIFKLKLIIYLLLGCTTLLFKNISRFEVSLLLIVLLIAVHLAKKIFKPSIIKQIDVTQLNWILIPLIVYSFFLPLKIIGLLMIAHFFSDRFANLVRTSAGPFDFKYSSEDFLFKDLSGTFIFILSNFILSLLYIYFFDGFILKKYILIFFINSIFLGLMENSFKINNFPDNFNINIFGSLFMVLSFLVDFRLRISSLNIVFGFVICFVFIVLFILFDIIKLKKSHQYYFIFVLLYTSLGYHLFLFNIIILTGMGIIKKLNLYFNRHIHYLQTFIKINEIKNYFLLTLIIALIYFILPYRHRPILKTSLIIGLIIAILHYLHEKISSFITRQYITIKKFKISREILLSNAIISLALLSISYFFNIMKITPLIFSFLYINIFFCIYLFLKSINLDILNHKLNKFFIVYFAFKIHFLLQLL